MNAFIIVPTNLLTTKHTVWFIFSARFFVWNFIIIFFFTRNTTAYTVLRARARDYATEEEIGGRRARRQWRRRILTLQVPVCYATDDERSHRLASPYTKPNRLYRGVVVAAAALGKAGFGVSAVRPDRFYKRHRCFFLLSIVCAHIVDVIAY